AFPARLFDSPGRAAGPFVWRDRMGGRLSTVPALVHRHGTARGRSADALSTAKRLHLCDESHLCGAWRADDCDTGRHWLDARQAAGLRWTGADGLDDRAALGDWPDDRCDRQFCAEGSAAVSDDRRGTVVRHLRDPVRIGMVV